MSNELATPTILACPSDANTKVARDFSSSPAIGFFALGNRNGSVSYFIGLDSFLTQLPVSLPYGGPIQAALGGDRNLHVDYLNVACSSGVTAAAGVNARTPNNVPPHTQWTNAIHGTVGNILMIDGQVAQTSNSRVVDAIAPSIDDNASFHLLMPH